MSPYRILFLVLISLWLTVGSAHAQIQTPTVNELQDQLAASDAVIEELTDKLTNGGVLTEDQRLRIQAAQADALVSYQENQASLMRNSIALRAHQQAVFAWQIKAANWLLLIVVVISCCGVIFAGYEMVAGRQMMMAASKAIQASNQTDRGEPEDPASLPLLPNPNDITFILEPAKVQIRSAVIGLVILTISLGFLYLFLKEVYSIRVIDLTNPNATAAHGSDTAMTK